MQETSPQDIVVFREALIRNKTREGLFASEGEEITFLGGQLFRTRLHFPANVPTGFYDVEVFMLQNGSVVHAQTTPLIVRKAGWGADVYFFAHAYAALYGVKIGRAHARTPVTNAHYVCRLLPEQNTNKS